MKIHALVLVALSMPVCLAPLKAEDPPSIRPDRAVGSVFGKTITAADIGLTAPIDTALEFDARDMGLWGLMGRISQAFAKPINDRFVEEHKIAATDQEIAEFKKTAREQRQKSMRASEDRIAKLKTELAAPDLSTEAKSKLEKELATHERVLPMLRNTEVADVPDEMARMFIVSRNTENELHKLYGGRMIFQQFGPEALDARRRLYEEAEKNGDLKFDDAGVRHMFYYYSNMSHVAIGEKAREQAPATRVSEHASVPIPSKLRQTEAGAEPPQAEKAWIISQSSLDSLKLVPTQIVPIEAGVWFGGRHSGLDSAPLGFMDLTSGQVTLLLENGGASWNAVGNEAIAVQLDRKSLIRLSAADRTVASWDKRPEGCRFYSQVLAHSQRFCISSPYNPLWIYDPWLETWQSIALRPVEDSDSARLGPDYYQPSMDRFTVGPGGDVWGFQGTRDATRGNTVCCYVPAQEAWQHFGFPWATNRGDDHWPIGETDSVVMFAGQKDLLFFDKGSHRWSVSPLIWPRGSHGAAQFTQQGILIPVDDSVKRLTPDFREWETVATLDSGERITAVAVLGTSLYLATDSGIHVLEETDANHFEQSKSYPWKIADQAKIFKAAFGLASEARGLALADDLCNAASVGDLDRVRALFSEGANTEATTDPAGSTPLLLACAAGHMQVAEFLIERGADLHATNKSRENALTMAARGGHRELADYLIARGAKR